MMMGLLRKTTKPDQERVDAARTKVDLALLRMCAVLEEVEDQAEEAREVIRARRQD